MGENVFGMIYYSFNLLVCKYFVKKLGYICWCCSQSVKLSNYKKCLWNWGLNDGMIKIKKVNILNEVNQYGWKLLYVEESPKEFSFRLRVVWTYFETKFKDE